MENINTYGNCWLLIDLDNQRPEALSWLPISVGSLWVQESL